MDEDGKKTAAQFEALEKGDDIPEKEPIKAWTYCQIVQKNCQLKSNARISFQENNLTMFSSYQGS